MFRRSFLTGGILVLSASAVAVDRARTVELIEPAGMAAPVVQAVTPTKAGSHALVEVAGVPAFELVVVLYSGDSGADPVGDCARTGLAQPSVRGASIADANGEAAVEVFVPSTKPDARVHLQVLTPESCDISDVVLAGFHP